MTQAAEAVAAAHRHEWAFVLAATVRLTRDLDLAQECAQEAYVAALQTWPVRGVPDRPGAWLTTTARRKALDRMRREQTLRRKLPLLIEPDSTTADGQGAAVHGGEDSVPDDRLRLVFTCCHPALSPQAQVALTLRLVCGVPTAEVARAFLVPEATMAARLTRAKRKIATARIPYRVPTREQLPGRLDSVLTAVHLLYTTGHTAAEGETLVRDEVCERALDLAWTLVRLLPEQAEARGLLGLLLLAQARRDARTDEAGHLVLLLDQDRRRWDQTLVTQGLRFAAEALSSQQHGRFTLQAAIAGVHAVAPDAGSTDWGRILRLYDALHALWPTPVVALNRAVALSFVDGPAAALEVVDVLAEDQRLAAYPYLPATRADLLRRLGRHAPAQAAYRQALALTSNAAERAFLQGRVREVTESERRLHKAITEATTHPLRDHVP